MEKRIDSGKKIRKSGKHGSIAFRRHSGVSTFVLSPQLGSAREIGSTQASASWTPVTQPPSAAAAAAVTIARYHHCCRPPTLLPPPLDDTAAASGRWRRRSLPLQPFTAASVESRPLPLLPTIVADRCRCGCRRCPLPLPPPAYSTTSGR